MTRDSYTIVAISDAHIGLDRFGATPAQWDAPLHEAVEARQPGAVEALIAGGGASVDPGKHSCYIP